MTELLTNLDFLGKALVPNLKLDMVPGDLTAAHQVLSRVRQPSLTHIPAMETAHLVNGEGSYLILQCLSQLLSRLTADNTASQTRTYTAH